VDVSALAAAYASAVPFRHVVMDDFLEPSLHEELRAAFEDEPADSLEDEIFHVMASKDPPEHLAFQRFRDCLVKRSMLDVVARITEEHTTSVELRAYAYLAGHYLLPHADRDLDGRRRVAFAYYVDNLEGLVGGSLDLYACTEHAGEIVETRCALSIEPRPNRCVLFEVSELSLHRVREVTKGGRLSIAGWFLK
jgi:2OG-Fe(II) oxygenase superfamily